MSVDSQFGLFGAIDRHNLGDLLMPWCFERLLQEQAGPWLSLDAEMSDLEERVGAESIESWHKRGGRSVLHVGGDILSCDWEIAHSFVSTEYKNQNSRPFPYLLPNGEGASSWENRFIYGAGGTGIESLTSEQKTNLKKTLTGMKIVVRDHSAHEALTELEIESKVAPCIVTLYPHLTDHHVDQGDNPIVFQASDTVAHKFGERIVTGLSCLAESMNNRRIVIVPAGLALGHDSFKSAVLLRQRLLKKGCQAEVLLEANPHSVAAVVANAGLVISSSLHLRILAIANSVPRVSFKIPKIETYIHNWDPGGLLVSDSDDLFDQAQAALEVTASDLKATADMNYETVCQEVSKLFELNNMKERTQISDALQEDRWSADQWLKDAFNKSLNDLADLVDIERTRSEEFSGQRDHYEGLKDLAERKQKEAENKAEQTKNELEQAEDLAKEFKGQRDHYQGLFQKERSDLETILQSNSWKMTKPLRLVKEGILQLKGRFAK